MLEVEGLRRPGVLDSGPFTLGSGNCLALRGASGAGKSLLLRALVDLDPNEGRVSLEGRERRSMPAGEWRRLLAYLPAESGWWASDVASHMHDPAAAKALLPAVNLPAEALDWQVSRLSTGERQRLALVRALILEPQLLLLDEPTAALDPETEAAVETLFTDFVSAGKSLILVTHNAAQAGRLATRSLTIAKGRLLQEASP